MKKKIRMMITSWAINLVLVNLKKLKSFKEFFSDQNTVRLDVNYRGKKPNY